MHLESLETPLYTVRIHHRTPNHPFQHHSHNCHAASGNPPLLTNSSSPFNNSSKHACLSVQQSTHALNLVLNSLFSTPPTSNPLSSAASLTSSSTSASTAPGGRSA